MPHAANQVSMYVCGPTVYADAHIGHAMAAIIFDMVRRYLIYRGTANLASAWLAVTQPNAGSNLLLGYLRGK